MDVLYSSKSAFNHNLCFYCIYNTSNTCEICFMILCNAGNGLKLLLDVERSEYVETYHSDNIGIKFLAHSPMEPPNMHEQGYGLAPGHHYLIALHQKEVQDITTYVYLAVQPIHVHLICRYIQYINISKTSNT